MGAMTDRDRSPKVTITVVYDNYSHQERLGAGWGFACVIRGLEKTVLFDTGGDGSLLLANMRALRIDPVSIDVVLLSHIDGDHTDGLQDFLAINPHVSVYMPASFPDDFKAKTARTGANVIEVGGPKEIFDGVFTTGELLGPKVEQGLVLSDKAYSVEGRLESPPYTGRLESPPHTGLGVVVSGCAHPGIDKMVGRAREATGAERFLILGGFHLFRSDVGTIRKMIVRLKQLGVEYAAPTHCSGDHAKQLFRDAFADGYIEVGAGKTIDISQLI